MFLSPKNTPLLLQQLILLYAASLNFKQPKIGCLTMLNVCTMMDRIEPTNYHIATNRRRAKYEISLFFSILLG